MNNTKSQILLKTPLHSLHLELGARLVPFAGYEMPVQYSAGIRKEHEHTRKSASLFDISHMGQIKLYGNDIESVLEQLVPGEIKDLQEYRQRYTVFTNESGGILDDLMVTKLPDCFFLVVNAACKQADFDYLREKFSSKYDINWINAALIAVQGPLAPQVMAKLQPELAQMPFLSAIQTSIEGISCLIHRCGYTGEDGYEISVSNEEAQTLTKILLRDESLEPAGLGARDSLRLEAGLCLYGHDLDHTTTPVEADLNWIIARKYRLKPQIEASFPGAKTIMSQLDSGPNRIRRGFLPESRIPVREETLIINSEGRKIGIITSGGYGQSIGKPVCMGYIDTKYDDSDDYNVEIRNQKISLTKVALPFVNHRYYK